MEIPYEVTARRDTGLWNAKIGIWLFLASEVMLFGGLFSGYVFLRIGVIDGVDNPWPTHVQAVPLGFTNTLVLIASSVFVVFSWVALKERSWARFQGWMLAVILCALAFLGIKAYEYYGKFTHYGIQLHDGSLLEAEIVSKTDRIRFEANEVTVDLNSGSMVFLGMLDDDLPKFRGPTGEEYQLPAKFHGKLNKGSDGLVDLKSWVSKASSLTADALKAQRVRKKEVDYHNAKVGAAMQLAKENGETYEGQGLREYEGDDDGDSSNGNPNEGILTVPTTITLIAEKPFRLHARPRKVAGHRAKTIERDGGKIAVINFIDGSQVAGTLIDDAVYVKLDDMHDIDLQRVELDKQDTAMVWDLLNDEKLKQQFFDHRELRLEKLEKYYGSRSAIPHRQLYSREVNVMHIDHSGHGEGHADEDLDDQPGGHGHGAAEEAGDHAAEVVKPETGGATEEAGAPGSDHASAEGGHEQEGALLKIPMDMIERVSNHGPQYGTYYAIYFTMTGLHGLHVIGGAIVLTYFLLFGKKLFLKNPEHMANRVEVGGLFWHFVDLVWIFLFPIMYLL